VILNQTHGDKIVVIDHQTPAITQIGDGLITNIPGRALSIKTADCFPLFLYDPKQQVIGLIHVGWLGANQGIHTKAIKILKSKFKSDPKDIIVQLGPGICSSCYTFTRKPTQSWGLHTYERKNVWHVNLKGFIKFGLTQAGIESEKITDMNICTYEDRRFPSHRRSRISGEPEDRFTSTITLE